MPPHSHDRRVLGAVGLNVAEPLARRYLGARYPRTDALYYLLSEHRSRFYLEFGSRLPTCYASLAA